MIFNKGTKIIQLGKGRLFNMVLGKLDVHMQKNEIRPLPYTIQENQLKQDQRSTQKS